MAEKDKRDKKIKMLVDDLASLERYIRELLTFLPIPVCFVSSLGVILEVNPAFEDVSGYGFSELIGKNVKKLFGKELKGLVARSLREEATLEREFVLKRKNGEEVPVTVFVRSRKDEEDSSIGAFISIFDLTKIKSTERALESKVEELQRFKELTMDRELKMVELKEEIESLREQLKQESL